MQLSYATLPASDTSVLQFIDFQWYHTGMVDYLLHLFHKVVQIQQHFFFYNLLIVLVHVSQSWSISFSSQLN